MAKKREDIFAPMDPLWGYPDMMSPKDVADFAGISESAARAWVQQHGGVIVIKGQKRDTWRIHKDNVRKGLNLPRAVG